MPSGGGRVEVDQLEQPRRRRDARGLLLGGGVAQRGDRPGHGLAPGRLDEVGHDVGGVLRRGLLDPDPSGLADHDRPALLGQLADLVVEAEHPHPDAGAAAEQVDHGRQRAQPAGPVEDHEHVRDRAHLVAHQLGAGVDQRGQLGQPAADRVLLGAEQDGVGVDPGVRQPPDPAPPGLAVLVAEDRHPDVTRAVQQGDLRHQPVCERLTGVVLAGETDHAEPGQVEPGRHPGEAARRRGLRGLGAALLHGHGGRQVGQPDPHAQVVGVGGPAFPQPRPGADRLAEQGRGVGAGLPALGPLGLQGAVHALGDRGQLLVVLLLPGQQVLAARPPVADEVGDRHQRGEQREQQVPGTEEQRHRHREQHRREHHHPRHRPLADLGHRVGEVERPLALRRQQPRRTVEVDQRLVGVGRDVGGHVAHLGPRQHGVTREDVRADRPRGPLPQRGEGGAVVDPGPERVRRGDRDRPVRGDGHGQRVGGQPQVRQRPARRTAADDRVTEGQPVDAAGARTRHHPELGHPVRHLASHQVGGLEEGHHAAVPDPDDPGGAVGLHRDAVHPQRHAPGEAAVHLVAEQLGQRLDQVAHRLGRVQVDQGVHRAPGPAVDHRQAQPHRSTPSSSARRTGAPVCRPAPSGGRQDAPFAR